MQDRGHVADHRAHLLGLVERLVEKLLVVQRFFTEIVLQREIMVLEHFRQPRAEQFRLQHIADA